MSLLPPRGALQARCTDPELMDLETCDPAFLALTVRQFKLLNRVFSASRRLIKRHFFSRMEPGRSRPYTLLDLGAGGCDIDVWIVGQARKQRIPIAITALDHDERVLAVAREAVAGYPEITLVHGGIDCIAALGDFDFVFANHLLHHLDGPSIGALLKAVESHTRIAYLLNDLKRSAWAYAGYSAAVSLLCRPSLAFNDGRLSILKGFTKEEWAAILAKNLPGTPVKVISAFPARLALFRER